MSKTKQETSTRIAKIRSQVEVTELVQD